MIVKQDEHLKAGIIITSLLHSALELRADFSLSVQLVPLQIDNNAVSPPSISSNANETAADSQQKQP